MSHRNCPGSKCPGFSSTTALVSKCLVPRFWCRSVLRPVPKCPRVSWCRSVLWPKCLAVTNETIGRNPAISQFIIKGKTVPPTSCKTVFVKLWNKYKRSNSFSTNYWFDKSSRWNQTMHLLPSVFTVYLLFTAFYYRPSMYTVLFCCTVNALISNIVCKWSIIAPPPYTAPFRQHTDLYTIAYQHAMWPWPEFLHR